MARTVVKIRDSDGTLVGVVTVPGHHFLRLWKQSARITWQCCLAGCQIGAGAAGSEEEAQAVLRQHLAHAHRLDLSRLSWS